MPEGLKQTIQLLSGSSPSNRRKRLLQEFLSAADWHSATPKGEHPKANISAITGNAVWLSQSSLATKELQRLIGLKSNHGRLQPGVRTLSHLAEAVASMAALGWQPLSKVEQQEIIRRLVSEREHRGALGLLEGLATSRGLVNFLSRRFDQLREIGITAEESTEFLRRNEGRAGKTIASLYSAYCQHLLKNNLFDRAARYELATKQIHNSKDQLSLLVIDRWLPDSIIERELLAALIANSMKSMVSIYGREQKTLSEHKDWATFFEDFGLSATRLEIPTEEDRTVDHVWASARIFDSTQKPQKSPSSSIELVAATNEQEEARQVARRVKQLLVEGKVSARSIVVASNQASQWNSRLESAFEEYGIPHATEQIQLLGKSPWFQLLRQLLTLKAFDWRREDLLAILSRADLQKLSASDRSAAEAVVRALSLPSGMAYLIHQIQTLASEGIGQLAPSACDKSICVLEQLQSVCENLPDEASPLGWFDALEAAAVGLQYASSIEQQRVNELAYATLQKALADLEVAFDRLRKEKSEIGSRVLLQYLEEWSKQLALSLPTGEEGKIRITSATNALGLEADHLFLVGISESSFAGLSDRYGLHVDPKELLFKQRILFQQLIAMPEVSLTLSYTALDDKAQSMQPSPFVAELERLYPADSLRRESFEIGKLQFEGEACSPREQRLAAMAMASEGDVRQLISFVAQSSSEQASSLLNTLQFTVDRWEGDTHGVGEGILLSEAASNALGKQYGKEHHWSASQLELYANCPYKFFARYVLGAIPFDADRFDIDHRRRGSLLHDAMVEFHSSLMTKLGAGDAFSDLGEPIIREALQNAITKVGRNRNLPNHEIALAEIELTESLAWADLYAGQYQKFDKDMQKQIALDEPMKPRYFEARFGPSGSNTTEEEVEDSVSTDEAFTLDLPGGEKLLLIGKIDRIDVGSLGDQTLFGIVDYKTGTVGTTKQDQITSGTKLQLALYALAADELFFPEDDAKLFSTGYWEIKKQGFQGLSKLKTAQIEEGVVEATEDWQNTIDLVKQRVEEMVHGIRRGEFPVYNPDEDCGRTCEFRTICRINQIRSRDKVWPPLDLSREPNQQQDGAK